MKLFFVEQGLRFVDELRNAEQRSGRKYFPISILMSYWTLKNKNLGQYLSRWVQRNEIELFIDSGAYSAYTMYQTIDVNAYGKWLIDNQGWYDYCANLDVKESWQKSANNLAVLESLGLHPLPVYHLGEPEYLYTDMLLNYDYICLGGVAGNIRGLNVTTPTIQKFARQAQAAGKRLHLFGIGAFPVLMKAPSYSADSSSYIGYRWGKIKIFDEVQVKYIQFQVGDPRLISYDHYFVRFGLPSFPAVMKRAGVHAASTLRAFEYLNMKRAEEYITAIWKVRNKVKP